MHFGEEGNFLLAKRLQVAYTNPTGVKGSSD